MYIVGTDGKVIIFIDTGFLVSFIYFALWLQGLLQSEVEGVDNTSEVEGVENMVVMTVEMDTGLEKDVGVTSLREVASELESAAPAGTETTSRAANTPRSPAESFIVSRLAVSCGQWCTTERAGSSTKSRRGFIVIAA